MSDLLTTKQVQELLQVDRTTIYRMLKDGRLSGVKLGHQWRFPVQRIKSLMNGRSLSLEAETTQDTQESLPIDCFQSIQDIFTDITQIGMVVTRPDGTPLTVTSPNCPFCQMLLTSKTGYQACQASRREIIERSQKQMPFAVCHAGLQTMQVLIKINNAADAILIAGQFYSRPPDEAEETIRIRKLAQKHTLNETELANAARDILILDGRQKAKISDWLNKMAATFEHISCERVGFMNRLQQIASMSDLTHDPIQTTAS